MRIEWDEEKARRNLAKHGVSFDAAAKVFEVPNRITELDWVVDHEARWRTIGRAGFVTVIFLVHTDETLEDQTVVRIISARKADRYERQAYEQGYLG
jgi:uncharacterized DUF497 family protein